MIPEEKIQIINRVFEDDSEISVTKCFIIQNKYFQGEIALEAHPNESLRFEVIIPPNYPLMDFGAKCCRFICLNQTDIFHLNNDNSVCLVVPKHSHLDERLRLEIAHLKEWRNKYYIRQQRDSRDDYLILPNQTPSSYFFTDTKCSFRKGKYGEFELAEWKQTDQNGLGCFITRIGNAICGWAKHLLERPAVFTGLFYFMVYVVK